MIQRVLYCRPKQFMPAVDLTPAGLPSWVFRGRFNDSILLSSGCDVIEYRFPSFRKSQTTRLKTCLGRGHLLWWSCGTVQRRIHRTREKGTKELAHSMGLKSSPGVGNPKVTSLNLNRHFIFQNGNISGKGCVKNGVPFPGTGTSNPPDWQLPGT